MVKWKESGSLFSKWGWVDATRMRIDEVHIKEESFHQQVWQMKLGDKSPTGRSLGFQFLYWLLLSFCRLPNSPASRDKWLHLSLRLFSLPPTFLFLAIVKRVWEFPDYKSAGWLAAPTNSNIIDWRTAFKQNISGFNVFEQFIGSIIILGRVNLMYNKDSRKKEVINDIRRDGWWDRAKNTQLQINLVHTHLPIPSTMNFILRLRAALMCQHNFGCWTDRYHTIIATTMAGWFSHCSFPTWEKNIQWWFWRIWDLILCSITWAINCLHRYQISF